MVEAVNELNVLRNFLIEIGEDQRTSKCYEDNKGVLDWANNQRSNSRLKKLEIADYVVREYKDNGVAEYIHVATDLQRADLFTKVLGPQQFNSGLQLLFNIQS
jgi:hypothetical protein